MEALKQAWGETVIKQNSQIKQFNLMTMLSDTTYIQNTV